MSQTLASRPAGDRRGRAKDGKIDERKQRKSEERVVICLAGPRQGAMQGLSHYDQRACR